MSSQQPSPDSRFLALRYAAQEATDFNMPDAAVARFIQLRDEGAGRDRLCEELSLEPEAVDALVHADEAQALAHRIATGEEPMYPAPEPGQRVLDTRAGSSHVPLAVLALVLVAAIAYALLR